MMCDFSTMASIAPRISARYDPTSSTPPSIATHSCMPNHAMASAIADLLDETQGDWPVGNAPAAHQGWEPLPIGLLAGCRHPIGHEVTWVARLRCRAVASGASRIWSRRRYRPVAIVHTTPTRRPGFVLGDGSARGGDCSDDESRPAAWGGVHDGGRPRPLGWPEQGRAGGVADVAGGQRCASA